MGGDGYFGRFGELGRHPRQDLLARAAISLHHAAEALLEGRGHHDETVVVAVSPRLDQERRFVDGQTMSLLCQRASSFDRKHGDRRMSQPFQGLELNWISKHSQ